MGCLGDDAMLELVDGPLPADDRAARLGHVGQCDRCRASLAECVRLLHPDPPPAEFHIGRYRIDAWIGEGAMGVVYRAHDPQIDRDVALKVVLPEFCAQPESILAEARAMGRLNHRNVLTVYDAGSADDTVYIASELVAGPNLREWLRERPRPQRELLDVFAQAGAGLAAAHRAGLVHRDFKPDNALVATGDDGLRVVVADFGLAGDAGAQMPAAGTVQYAAPEQRTGGTVDARSDQYAFCVALHEALVGCSPDAARHDMGRKSRLPAAVAAVLARGLQPRPADRFPSMQALLTQLAPRRRRSKAVVLSWGAALAIAAIAGGAALRPDAPAHNPPPGATTPPPSQALDDARALRSEGSLSEALAEARRVAQRAGASTETALQAEAVLLQAKLLFALHGAAKARDAVWTSVNLARTANRRDLQAEGLLAAAAMEAGNPTAEARARAWLSEARALIRESQLGGKLGHVASYVAGRVDYEAGHFDAAAPHFAEAVERASQALADDHPFLAQYRVSWASALSRAGKHRRAREIYDDAATRAGAALGDGTPRFAAVLAEIGSAQANAGDCTAAVERFEGALKILLARVGPTAPVALDVRASLAHCLAETGRLSSAREQLSMVVSVYRDNTQPIALADALLHLGDLDLSNGAGATAIVAYDEALALAARASSQTALEARALTRTGLARLLAGHDTFVREPLERAVALHDVLDGDPLDRADAEFALCRAVVRESDDYPRAYRLAVRAIGRLEAAGIQGERRAQIAAWVDEHFGDAIPG